MLNAAIAAFAHRAISERNLEILACEALAYIAAGLGAERAEIEIVSADGASFEVMQQFPSPRNAAPKSQPFCGDSIAAEAYASRNSVVREAAEGGDRYDAATAIECDGRVCVFAVYSCTQQKVEAARNGLDAIAAMYAAAVVRSRAEAQLADGERRLRLLLDQIPAIVSTLDKNLVFTSAQGAGLTALTPEVVAGVLGRTLAEVVSGDESCLPLVSARKVLAGTPTQYEWVWQGRTYENRMEPLRDAAGEIVGIINLGLDVTEKRLAAAELLESREELRRLSAALRQIDENQRRLIAREIHDDLGQRLTALRLDLGLLRQALRDGRDAGAEERIEEMIALVDETVDTARRLATELRPTMLDDLGFAATLEHEAESFARRSGIGVSLNIEPEEIAIEPQRATALYRVIQEALTNVARHAGATRVEVRVEGRGGRIEAEVRDNGRGIADEELHNDGALGLIGIRERIFQFDGEVHIERVDSGGTRVFVSVPDDENPDRG